jgi:hypothetical protein
MSSKSRAPLADLSLDADERGKPEGKAQLTDLAPAFDVGRAGEQHVGRI